MAIALVLSGATGRMGRTLEQILAGSSAFRIVGGIVAPFDLPSESRPENSPPLVLPEDAADVLAQADAVLDFSVPGQLLTLLQQHGDLLAGRALVVGTTALDDDVLLALDGAARRGPVVRSANFSVGVNLLLALVERAAGVLGPDLFDVEIVELHHRQKRDSPSGTAIALGELIAAVRNSQFGLVRRDGRSGMTKERPPDEIGVHSLRGGDSAGEHRILFLGNSERIELMHQANDRSIFAHGALLAVRWAVGREAGHYSMRDVLGA